MSTDSSENKDERTWAMACHLASLAGYCIPFGNVVGPLIVWMMKRDELPMVADQGKEAMNFQITVSIAYLLCIPLMFVLIGFFMLAALGVYSLILTVIAAVKANEGQLYRYPLTIRFV